MKWAKKGRIFVPDQSLWWAKQYAGIPTVENIDDKFFRIYYYSMDENMDGRISFIDVDIDDPSRIINIEKEPILDIGSIGTFDDSGICPSCIITINNKKHLYYLGVQRCEKAPYMYFAGVAIQEDDGKFYKHARTPILDRTSYEPFTRSATSIIFDESKYRMWYVSAFSWITFNNKPCPAYIIKHAESDNGIDWSTDEKVCIGPDNPDEFGFGRPWVIKENGIYKMWYSIRSYSKPYEIGYGESLDGLNWIRKDNEAGISRSVSGWDSEMICYPCVIDAHGKRYMFHNGNRHGSTGFGYAILESE